ncbi:hypothetical protein LCGC14_1687750 [marine sediment metagenome]|uniref:Uncharacterized protein n=1 Tax=marine sediment metagenome TaxID=412755 RepID=A0A0F9HM53_9ZZZZ
MRSIKEWQVICYKIAVEKGWWDKPRSPLESAALIHSEISEYVEDIRNGMGPGTFEFEPPKENHKEGDPFKPIGPAIELADALIRIFDLAEYHKINLEDMLELKTAFNKTRPYRHGGKLA